MSRKHNLILTLIVCIVLFLAVLAGAGAAVCFYAIGPVTDVSQEYSGELKVPQGMTVREAAQELEQQKLIRSWRALYLAARFNLFDRQASFNLKSGLYTVKSSMPLKDVYMLLQTGTPESIHVSIPEGLTMTKTAHILEDAGLCRAEDFLACCRSQEILDSYGIPLQSLEGYLFPDTYFFTPDETAESIVRRLADTFFLRVAEISSLSGIDAVKLSRIVILASIVEREYQAEDEAPLIASVFKNRLDNGIGLESCATIEYILTESEGRPHPDRIMHDDLKIDSPYNTYMWAALPPGPIANPGMVALSAAANPAETDYYYFVLTDPAAGRHTFSKNFDQHIRAKNLYTKKAP